MVMNGGLAGRVRLGDRFGKALTPTFIAWQLATGRRGTSLRRSMGAKFVGLRLGLARQDVDCGLHGQDREPCRVGHDEAGRPLVGGQGDEALVVGLAEHRDERIAGCLQRLDGARAVTLGQDPLHVGMGSYEAGNTLLLGAERVLALVGPDDLDPGVILQYRLPRLVIVALMGAPARPVSSKTLPLPCSAATIHSALNCSPRGEIGEDLVGARVGDDLVEVDHHDAVLAGLADDGVERCRRRGVDQDGAGFLATIACSDWIWSGTVLRAMVTVRLTLPLNGRQCLRLPRLPFPSGCASRCRQSYWTNRSCRAPKRLWGVHGRGRRRRHDRVVPARTAPLIKASAPIRRMGLVISITSPFLLE